MIGLSIDPGKSTGICLFYYTDEGFEVIERWQFMGGAERLHIWCKLHVSLRDVVGADTPVVVCVDDEAWALSALVVEKFTPHDNEGFSLTLDSVEPLVGEGVLIAHNLKPFITWRQPSQQYFMGDSRLPLAEKKKAARRFLETNGLLPTGKEFGQPDANDAISATLHAIGWLRSVRHMPTLLQLFP